MSNWILLIIGALGLGVGGYFVARNPKFWVGLVKEIYQSLLPAFLKLLDNRPKTEKEWAEWRELSSIVWSDMSPKQRARYKELKKLNAEYRKNK